MQKLQVLPQVEILCSEREDGDFRGRLTVVDQVQRFTERPISLTHLQLQHGSTVVCPQNETTMVADAAVIAQGTQGISMVVGDCFPIVLVDQTAGVLAMIHGGWRSLALGILQKTLAVIKQQGADMRALRAWIGPGARSCCYRSAEKPLQINEHDWSSVIQKVDLIEQEKNSSKNEWKIDLPKYIYQELIKNGVQKQHVFDEQICTVCHPERYYSHQRSKRTGDIDGRFLVIAYWR